MLRFGGSLEAAPIHSAIPTPPCLARLGSFQNETPQIDPKHTLGPQRQRGVSKPQYTMILISGTPKMKPPIFGSPHSKQLPRCMWSVVSVIVGAFTMTNLVVSFLNVSLLSYTSDIPQHESLKPTLPGPEANFDLTGDWRPDCPSSPMRTAKWLFPEIKGFFLWVLL